MKHPIDSLGTGTRCRRELHHLDLKGRLWRDLAIVHNYLMEWCGEDGVGIVLWVPQSKKNKQHRKFQLIKGRLILLWWWSNNRTGCPGRLRNLHLISWKSPKRPSVTGAAWPLEVLSKPNRSSNTKLSLHCTCRLKCSLQPGKVAVFLKCIF